MYFFRVIHKLLVIYWLLYFILKNLLIELILSIYNKEKKIKIIFINFNIGIY